MNGKFGGGDGTINNPFLVEDADDLDIGIRNNPALGYNSYYKQVADIDMTKFNSLVPKPSYWDEHYEVVGGYYYYGFTPLKLGSGRYDGNGFKISNLYIEDDVTSPGVILALFTQLEGGAYVKNVHLENALIVSHYSQYVGGLVGYGITLNMKILNCSVKGMIRSTRTTGKCYIGGIVGYLSSGNTEIDRCEFTGDIVGYGTVGGIAGYCDGVSNCKVIAYLEAHKSTNEIYCGGITGFGGADKCIYKGIIRGEMDFCGGILGYGGRIEKCAAYIQIENSLSSGYNGGLSGYGMSRSSYNGINNCHAIGTMSVAIDSISGGLVGNMYNIKMKYCYSVVTINNNIIHEDNISAIGNGVSEQIYNLFNSDKMTDSLLTSNGRTETQLKDINTYLIFSSLYVEKPLSLTTNSRDGDVHLSNSESVYYAYGYVGTRYEANTRIAGTWRKQVTRVMKGISWLGTDLGQNDGDFYIYLDDTVEPMVYVVKQWAGSGYVDVGILDASKEVRYLYYYNNKYKDIENSNKNYFSVHGATYRYYTDTINNNLETFNFYTIWGIDSEYNNGYPFLRELDYTGIFDVTILGYLKIQTTNKLCLIPLYEDEGSKGLIVNTPKGLAEIRLVDVTDSKASPIRVKTADGIKSLSL